MRSELPAERLQRRLSADPDADAAEADDCAPEDASDHEQKEDDQNSLLPRWLPDASQREGWMARVRADPGRAGAIAAATVAALAVLVTVFTVLRDRPPPVMSAKLPPVERVSGTAGPGPKSSATPGAAQPGGVDRPVVVSVVGLVHTPGLVTLVPGARIADALQAAGGAMDGADTIGLNMARPVGDGEQIVVGLAPLSGLPRALGSSVASGSAPGPASAPESAPGRPTGGPTTGPKEGPTTVPKRGPVLDLNTATLEQLDALPGVGPVTAAAILAWRQANGKFTSVDQLGDVDGIGPARLDRLRALVRV
jgi:competence protein ComEA